MYAGLEALARGLADLYSDCCLKVERVLEDPMVEAGGSQ